MHSMPPAGAAWRAWSVLLAALVLYGASQYAFVLNVPFINEDYAFLDVTRDHSIGSLWKEPGLWAGPWFRPWSQGLHYWLMQRWVGLEVVWWHVVNVALWMGVLFLYFALVRRGAGLRAAFVCCAGAATLAPWGILLAWIAGVQDLWMQFLSLAALLAAASQRRLLAAAALALALASKETATVVPAVAMSWRIWIDRRSIRQSIADTWALWAVALAWLVFHPTLGQAIGAGDSPGVGAVVRRGAEVLGRAVLATVNADVRPSPEGWGFVATSILGGVVLGALIAWGARHAGNGAESGAANVSSRASGGAIGLGLTWTALGWAPLLIPGLGWHPYYGLFGMLGLWLALGAVLARHTRTAVAVVVLLAFLRGMRAATPSQDWGEEAYARRAGEFLRSMSDELLAREPSPGPHARFFFHGLPIGVGFLVGDGPSLRVWYGDSTLVAGYFRDYRVRAPARPEGRDLFFRYDSLQGWVAVRPGPENIGQARLANPRWREDHELLAFALDHGGSWDKARTEFAKLAAAFPDSVSYPYIIGTTALTLGDTATAREWLERAAAVPAADDEVRAAAAALRLR